MYTIRKPNIPQYTAVGLYGLFQQRWRLEQAGGSCLYKCRLSIVMSNHELYLHIRYEKVTNFR
uniref:Uncharacterized protein n=1 Tax=Anguilla anguilla TaxID=7936 RepID=A0A0E9WTA9_ANGAN